MTIKELKQYRYICRKLQQLASDIEEKTAFDSVSGSNPDYPYQMRTYSLYGVDPNKDNDLLLDANTLHSRKVAIENYINSIEGP